MSGFIPMGSVLDHPSMGPRSADAMMPGQTGENQHDYGDPSGLPNTTFSNSQGKDYGSDATSSNGRTNVHLAIDMDYQQPGHYISNVPMFIYRQPAGEGAYACRMRERSIMSLNYYLQSVDGRREYGRDKTCERLLADWSLFGVGLHDPTPAASRYFEKTQVYTVAKRARVRGLMMSQNRGDACPTVAGQTRVFIICRAYKWKDPLRMLFQDQTEGQRKEILASFPEFKKRSKAQDNTQGSNKKQKKTKKDEDEWYWQMEFFNSPDGSPPSSLLFKHKWKRGAYFYLGKITAIYGPSTDDSWMTTTAREALHPIHEGDDHNLKAMKLGDVEIQLFIW